MKNMHNGIHKIALTVLLVFVLFFMLSCEKDLKIKDLPSAEPQPVVHCYLSPQDDSIRVILSFSKPLFNWFYTEKESDSLLKNAVVKLSSAQKSVFLTKKYKKNVHFVYTIVKDSLEVLPGHKYSLECSFRNGIITTSNCTIPLFPPDDIFLDNIMILPYYWDHPRMRISYHFTDTIGEGDYYFVSAIYKSEYSIMTTYSYKDGWSYLEINHQSNTISDKGIDGSTFYLQSDGYGNQLKRILFRTCRTDEHYYKYRKAVINYNPEDAFAEPVFGYTNITNGLGIFAGVNMRDQEFILQP